MILSGIVCGFQDGADIGAAYAAKIAGVPLGGWMPLGFRTESGCRPGYARLYGAKETQSPDYPSRTKLNVHESDALLWFGDPDSRGGRLTIGLAKVANLRVLVLHGPGGKYNLPPGGILAWIDRLPAESGQLMVAGNRESSFPGLGAWVGAQMVEVFRLMAARVTS